MNCLTQDRDYEKKARRYNISLFPIENDCLVIRGVTLNRLAQRIGKTPFYAYDRDRITQRVKDLRRSLPNDVSLHYAIKANPMPAVVQHLASLVDGLDIASSGELRVALDTPMSSQHMSFAGPGKSDSEICQAIAAGVTINLESGAELERVARAAHESDIEARVAVRVNPDFELKSSGMKMSGGPKPFGVDADRVPATLRQISVHGLSFQGLHIFSGSQNLKAEAIAEAQEKTFELTYRLAESAPGPIQALNIGGGFGIPYFPGDIPLDIGRVGENLERLMYQMRARLPHTRVVIELGRYLVGEAGVYVCRVVDRKLSRGQVFLVTDGGLHHHLAASGNFGQVIRKNYPVLIGNKVQGKEREVVSVVGPLCTPLDLLADKMEMAKAEVGDLVVVLQSGAYGLSASPTQFLSHPPPLEVLV
ncbi:MAG: pyridoxal-dependent decarboxylase, exosortase A system-associated [Gammaproteobacteria bacterium]|nr:pyridoxal-dependent decarboxylase, exosortase A system-associated [Gammaproteobacteria bacterium]